MGSLICFKLSLCGRTVSLTLHQSAWCKCVMLINFISISYKLGIPKNNNIVFLFFFFQFQILSSAFSCQRVVCSTFSSTIPYIKSQLSSALKCGNSSKQTPNKMLSIYFTILYFKCIYDSWIDAYIMELWMSRGQSLADREWRCWFLF